MPPTRELLYLMLIGAAVLSALLLGLAWLSVRLLKIDSRAQAAFFYVGAILVGCMISFFTFKDGIGPDLGLLETMSRPDFGF